MEDIHDIEVDIHSTFDTGSFIDGSFESRIQALSGDYITGNPQNLALYSKVIRELNRKLYFAGFANLISGDYNGGLWPEDATIYFVGGGSGSEPSLFAIFYDGEPILYNGEEILYGT